MYSSNTRIIRKIVTLGILLFCLGFFSIKKPAITAGSSTNDCPNKVTCSDGGCCETSSPVCCPDWCCPSGYKCGVKKEAGCVRPGKRCQDCYDEYDKNKKECKDGDADCVNRMLGIFRACLKHCE
jgi:hypothetical protein